MVKATGLKCKSCGNELTFDPTSKMMACAHCGAKHAIDGASTVIAERDFVLTAESEEEWHDGKSYRCENCGATTVLAKGEIATTCPFCGAPKVVAVEDQPGIKPMGVVPFTVSRESAHASLKKFVKKRWFAPCKFKKAFSPEKTQGVYVPAFLFDTRSHARYTGTFGRYYTVVVGSGKNRKTVRKIRWYTSSGVINRNFNDYAIEASARLEQAGFEKIMPWSTDEPRKYEPEYLLGYVAERYEDGPEACFKRACEGIKEVFRREAIARENADVVQSIVIDVVHEDVKYKYLLLPVWTCSETYKNKKYGYVINGETGKATGKTPVSPFRATIVGLVGVALLALIIHLITQS